MNTTTVLTANADTKLNLIPVNFLVKCGKIPIIATQSINDLKIAYIKTQDELINICERHRYLVDSIEDLKK